MTLAHEGCGHTLHRITNVAVEAVDDTHATARSYVDAIIMGPNDHGGMHAIGFYDDELVHTDDGWKINRRSYTMVHLEPVGAGVTLYVRAVVLRDGRLDPTRRAEGPPRIIVRPNG